MGHYRSEMWCNTCGNHPCTCPQPPQKDNSGMWVVGTNFEVQTVKEWLAAYHKERQRDNFPVDMSTMYLMSMKQFEKRADAVEVCRASLMASIDGAGARQKTLKKKLKELK